MSRAAAIHTLFIFWAIFTFVLASVIGLQSVFDFYGSDRSEAWAWFLSVTTAPSVLITAAFFSDPPDTWKQSKASPVRLLLALGSSVLLALISVLTLFSDIYVDISIFSLFEMLSVPMALVQGVVLSALSAVIFEQR